MTGREVVEAIRKNLGSPWNDRSMRDTFKIGDPDAAVTGIACTWMATLDVIRRAHEAKLNFIVNHEDTWWNDRDDVKDLAGNKIYELKSDYCRQNGIVIWRFHDHQHSRKPDQSIVAELRLAGVEDESAFMNSGKVYAIPETTLGGLASAIRKRTAARALRIVGDPKMKVRRILVGPGYASPTFTPDVDVVIGGEGQESDGGFDNTGYVLDAAELGIPKGQIILGHGASEEPGMEECARWLRTFITGVPVQFIPAGEPYWT